MVLVELIPSAPTPMVGNVAAHGRHLSTAQAYELLDALLPMAGLVPRRATLPVMLPHPHLPPLHACGLLRHPFLTLAAGGCCLCCCVPLPLCGQPEPKLGSWADPCGSAVVCCFVSLCCQWPMSVVGRPVWGGQLSPAVLLLCCYRVFFAWTQNWPSWACLGSAWDLTRMPFHVDL